VSDQVPRFASLAAKLLARSARTESPRALGDRAATVAALEEVLRNRSRRRTVGRVAFGMAAASLVLVAWQLGASRPGRQQAATEPPAPPPLTALAISLPGEPASVARAGRALQLGIQRGSVGLSAGDRLRTGRRGRLAVSLSTGTRVDLGADSDLELSELGSAQRFVLRGGRIHAQVVKLAAGQRFLIDTPDAEVEVRGTSFDVVLLPAGQLCPGEPVTQVRVREGLVVVRGQEGEQQLAAGGIWQSACARQEAAAVTASRSVLRPARRSTVAPKFSPSTLRAQNDLFGAALEARRRGDVSSALRLIDDLLVRFPGSPLTESARAEREKLTTAPAP
jgi:ferric-dicitrate binding protein FerR (iron transport regulator)